jgi:AcrR family transcriptional regulator
MVRATQTSRKDRILDAAEHAFADLGFDGASLRQIVQRAKVNLATVYYYFGSKEGLMVAVFVRRIGPLRQEQMEMLHRFEEEAGLRPLRLEKILEAMLLPPLRLMASASVKDKAVTRLIGRLATEPNPHTQELVRREFEDARMAFVNAFRRSLPTLPLPDLRWRIEFVWGTLAFVLCNPGKIEMVTGGLCNPSETPTVLAQMILFFCAGFHAPALGHRAAVKSAEFGGLVQ